MSLSRRAFLASGIAALVAGACAGAQRRPAGPVGVPPSRARTDPNPDTVPGSARFVGNGDRGGNAYALTFHASGDVALTIQMLDHLARLGAPTTIFAVGTWLEANPTMAHRILGAGHELANHTYTHPGMGGLGRMAVAEEIRRCRDVLVRQIGHNAGWFRPSGVDRPSPLMLEEAGAAGYATVVGFDVDPHDYQDPGADAVASRTIAGVVPGSIVSLHLGHPGTISAIDRIVAGARARGLHPVVLRDLIGPPTA